ncbi:MAG: DUF2179 domain-containing protein [Candidatus Aenigmarchaeota archaeon]|nr:DUF2179 domain-containing protein [Candidatus Aenigmarchaeota archaeon]
MDFISFMMNSEFLGLVVIPVFIFLARILDVTMGTIRIIFISKGLKYLAPLVGFFEVLVWLLAITQIMQNLTNFMNYIAYAGGFAIGTFFGIYLESKLAMGYLSVVTLTKKDPTGLIEKLEICGYKTTSIDAKGKKSNVEMVFTIVKRKRLRRVVNIIKNFDPRAFYSVEDVKYMHEIHLPHAKRHAKRRLLSLMSRRKGK